MLAPKKYPGLLVTPADKEQALYKGLLGLGAQLSQGYTDKPTSFMGNLGQAGLGFQKGYGDQIALTKADQLQNMQAQSAQAQLAAQKIKIEQQKQEQLQNERLMNYYQMDGKDMAGNPVPMPMTPGLAQYKAQQKMKAFAPRSVVPGRDAPFPEDVQAQRLEIARTTAGATAPLQQVQTPTGPRLVPRSEAVGQKPFIKPSAAGEKAYQGYTESIDSGREAINGLEQALKLSETAYDGVTAQERAFVVKNSPDVFVSEEERNAAINTGLMDKIVQQQALSSLKATFGGMPSEGERKILLEIQGSSELPKAERDKIWTRAIEMAKKRIALNKKKALQYEKRYGSDYSLGYGTKENVMQFDSEGNLIDG
tara:strand:- start:1879 stop:2979 length:1101 start_codon:yes stop_codon:yes gene_type:complete